MSVLSLLVVWVNKALVSGAERMHHRAVAMADDHLREGDHFKRDTHIKKVEREEVDLVKEVQDDPAREDNHTSGDSHTNEAEVNESYYTDKLEVKAVDDLKEDDQLKELEGQRDLPLFAQGGVIVWLHVPKTVSQTVHPRYFHHT